MTPRKLWCRVGQYAVYAACAVIGLPPSTAVLGLPSEFPRVVVLPVLAGLAADLARAESARGRS